MSVDLYIEAFAGKNSKEFQKHLRAVKFCIEEKLSFPEETSKFFKGRVGGDDLEDITPSSILEYIENGIKIPMRVNHEDNGKARISISDIPKEVDEIVISLQ